MSEKRDSKLEISRSAPSHFWHFRQKTQEALLLEDEINNKFSGSVTRYFKDVLKNRHRYAKHKQKAIGEVFDLIEEKELTVGDIKDSSRWREFVEKTQG